jgi:hypothetical protein
MLITMTAMFSMSTYGLATIVYVNDLSQLRTVLFSADPSYDDRLEVAAQFLVPYRFSYQTVLIIEVSLLIYIRISIYGI